MPGLDLTIGLIAHHVFCPRRAWLELHGERTDTEQMSVGVRDHVAVDDPATSRASRCRAVDVSSEELGFTGRCDSIEQGADGELVVVEHKANPLRRKSEVTDAQAVQLALQAIALREADHRVDGAAVWFTTTRERVEVPLTKELLVEAGAAAQATRSTLIADSPPPPLEDDDRCRRCSHVTVCLPDEHRRRNPARRIAVGDPFGRVLHLSTPGSRASIRRGRIAISTADSDPELVPIGQVCGLVVHGNADVSSALLREILSRGYPIVWCTWSGRVIGWASPADGPNGHVRGPQHRLRPEVALDVARSVVRGKIRNQRYILRRHQLDGSRGLSELSRDTVGALGRSELFGIEGRAATRYFSQFGSCLKQPWASFAGRSGRLATDPINAALNLVYSLLLADMIRAVAACGLDPSGGVLHSAGRNKPALALDLMEEFRPIVADSAVLWAVNNGELRASDFRTDFDVVRLGVRGRKALIGAYERRMSSEFRHPHFGYRVSWRRAMEVQARMFLALAMGERADYRPIVMR